MFALQYLCVIKILFVRNCPDLYGVNDRIVTCGRRVFTRTQVTVTRDWFQRVPSTVSSATDPMSDLRTTPTGLVTGRKLPPVTPYAWGKKPDYISCECIIGCLFEESQKYASKMVLGCVIFPINGIFVGKTGLKHISVTHCKIKIINNILNLLCDFTSKYVYNVITDRVLLQIFYLK